MRPPQSSFRRYGRYFAPLIVVIPYALFVLDNRFLSHKVKKLVQIEERKAAAEEAEERERLEKGK